MKKDNPMFIHFHKFDIKKFNNVLSVNTNSNAMRMYFTYRGIRFEESQSNRGLKFFPIIPASIDLPTEQFVRDLVKSLAKDLNCYVEAEVNYPEFTYACYQTTEIKDSTREVKLIPSLKKLADLNKDLEE